jgi:hypothetical protein
MFRSELHEDGLITNLEYHELLQDTKSRARLDGYAQAVTATDDQGGEDE